MSRAYRNSSCGAGKCKGTRGNRVVTSTGGVGVRLVGKEDMQEKKNCVCANEKSGERGMQGD